MKKTNKLTLLLISSTLDGAVPLAALTGLFKIENAFSLALVFMAGPAAIMTAALFDGAIRERMLAALLAGVIATAIVMLAAGLGPQLLSNLNTNVLKIGGGIAVLSIGLLIMGVNIPEKLPMLIMIGSLVLSLFWRTT